MICTNSGLEVKRGVNIIYYARAPIVWGYAALGGPPRELLRGEPLSPDL